MEAHIRELLDRYQYSEEVKQIAAFRVLFGGEDASKSCKSSVSTVFIPLIPIYTLNHWVAAYRKRVVRGLISLPPTRKGIG